MVTIKLVKQMITNVLFNELETAFVDTQIKGIKICNTNYMLNYRFDSKSC